MRSRLGPLAAALLCVDLLGASAIPPDLAARAASLQAKASPQFLTWAKGEARALAKPGAPLDAGAVKRSVEQRFPGGFDLGRMSVEDAVMLLFLLAAEDAEAELNAQLAGMDRERKQRDALRQEQQDLKKAEQAMKATIAAAYPTPTPTPLPSEKRLSQLVDSARKVSAAR